MKPNENSIYTKRQLLPWLNELLHLHVSTLEELSNGAAFCQLLDLLSSGDVRMQKVNWNAKLQHQNLNNLKILSTSMLAMGIDKKFNVERISQKKTQDILELLQWFRKYFLTNSTKNSNYDPTARRRTFSAEKIQLEVKTPQDSSKNKNISNLKMSVHLAPKSQPEDLVNDNQLKNCFKVNRAIEKIISENTDKAEKKLELIKSLLFQNKQQESRKQESPKFKDLSHQIQQQIPNKNQNVLEDKVKFEQCQINQECLQNFSITSNKTKPQFSKSHEGRQQTKKANQCFERPGYGSNRI